MSNNLPKLIPGGSALVEEHDGNFVVGKEVRFDNKGARYTVGTETLPTDVLYKPRGLITCWERRENGHIVERHVTQPDQPHPQRKTLGCLDEDDWSISKYTGNPEDPWQDTRYLYFLNQRTCMDYTYVTRTIGGRLAISDLKRMFGNFAEEYPGEMPLLEFGHVMWNTRYGLQPRPQILVAVTPPREDLRVVPLSQLDGAAQAPRVIEHSARMEDALARKAAARVAAPAPWDDTSDAEPDVRAAPYDDE